ncbi:aconitase family protein [Pendulispora albinea]|uniref:Aconitase/3-isopropylmalate dehydratase large subunit alpha/beta/alpha domain-containing protein n=1 Tax=Pendulispora albinea TaxID=2741071 RepID=A0ABZ2LKG4_9BACT
MTSIEVKADQVVLARDPRAALAEGLAAGLKKATPELAVAYDTICVRDPQSPPSLGADCLSHGITLVRPGAGFAAPVHLERFASPARLAVTDEPRLAALGGIGMLTVVVPTAMLGQALAKGRVKMPSPRSIHVQLTGRLRPFVGVRDVAFEWIRRDLAAVVKRVCAACHAPVVLEFGGPGARFLSVSERAILCAMAPRVGAWAALFPSDERTEVFLRDERRSKAHRSLVPDGGAPFEEVVSLDLGGVDPLVMTAESDETDLVSSIHPVRDLAGKPVSQVLLGGGSGVTLRELFVVATLLKSKRVPKGFDFLLAVPSRQMLEVLAEAGALADLIATGARLVEPDPRVASGALYPPPAGAGLSLSTGDLPRGGVVVSAETLAYAVATGKIGDPRAFKRPVRVTVPRALPTDDVFVHR